MGRTQFQAANPVQLNYLFGLPEVLGMWLRQCSLICKLWLSPSCYGTIDSKTIMIRQSTGGIAS